MKRIITFLLIILPMYLLSQIQIGTPIEVMSQELLDFKGSVVHYSELTTIIADTGQVTYVIDSVINYQYDGSVWSKQEALGSDIWIESGDSISYDGSKVEMASYINFTNTDVEDVLTFNEKPIFRVAAGRTSVLAGYYNGLNSNVDATHMANAAIFGYRNYVNAKWFNIGSLFGYNNVIEPKLTELTDSLITDYWTLGSGWMFVDPVGLNKSADGLGTVTPITWTTVANELYRICIETGTVSVSGVSVTIGGVTSPTTITASNHKYTFLIETTTTGTLTLTPLLTSARLVIESISITKSFYLDNNNTNAFGYNNFNFSSATEDSGMYQTNGLYMFGKENGTAMEYASNVYLFGNNLMDGNIEPNVTSVKDKMIFGLSATGDTDPTLDREGILVLSHNTDDALSYADFNFDEIRQNGTRLSLGSGINKQVAVFNSDNDIYGTRRFTYDSIDGIDLWDKLTLQDHLNFTGSYSEDVITINDQPFLKIFGQNNSSSMFGTLSGQLSWLVPSSATATSIFGYYNAIRVNASIYTTIIGSRNIWGNSNNYYNIGPNGSGGNCQIVIGTSNLIQPITNRDETSLDQFIIIGNDIGSSLDSASHNFYLYGNSLYADQYDEDSTLLENKMIFGIRGVDDTRPTDSITSIVLDAADSTINFIGEHLTFNGTLIATDDDLLLKADLASPIFTGTVTIPTLQTTNPISQQYGGTGGWIEGEFFTSSTNVTASAISSGIASLKVSSTNSNNHPGIYYASSHASNANSGYSFSQYLDECTVGDVHRSSIYIKDTTNGSFEIGIANQYASITQPTVGCYFYKIPGNKFRTVVSNAGHTFGDTTYTAALNTWYTFYVHIYSATWVHFWIKTDDGTIVFDDWTNTSVDVSTAGVACYVTAYFSGSPGGATELCHIDRLAYKANRVLVRPYD